MIDSSESPNATGVARVLIQGLHMNKFDDITSLFVLNVGKLKRLTPTLLSTHLPHSADYPTDYSAYEVFNFFRYTLQTTPTYYPKKTTKFTFTGERDTRSLQLYLLHLRNHNCMKTAQKLMSMANTWGRLKRLIFNRAYQSKKTFWSVADDEMGWKWKD